MLSIYIQASLQITTFLLEKNALYLEIHVDTKSTPGLVNLQEMEIYLTNTDEVKYHRPRGVEENLPQTSSRYSCSSSFLTSG